MPDYDSHTPTWVKASHFWQMLEDRTAGSFYWDRQEDAVQWSPKLLSVLGHSDQQACSLLQVEDLMHPDDRQLHADTIVHAIESSSNYTIDIRLKNNRGIYQSLRAQGYWLQNQDAPTRFLMGFLTEISEVAHLREQVARIAGLFQAFFDHAPAAVYMKDSDRKHIYGNAVAAKIAGCTVDEFIGSTTAELFDKETDRALIDVDRRILESGETVVRHGAFRAANGELHYVYDTSFPIEDPLTGEKLIGGVGLDTTRQHLAEAALARSQKMEALGRLVGGIAHDFNNTLAVLQGNVELIETAKTEIEKEECLAEIGKGIERGANLTRQLLAYARKSVLTPELLNLNDVLGDTDRMLRSTLPKNIVIETVAGGNLWNTRIDKGQVENAILNLALNARDAMPEGGELVIETSNARLGAEDLLDSEEDLAPGRFVLLSVSDTGEGMSEETMQRAFDPFFTTKKMSEGTGMGLSMVEGLMQQIGGAARLRSEPGLGTTVTLLFPTSDDREPEGRSKAARTSIGPKHILLAEDDEGVRDVLRRQLTRLGYRVTEARNGDRAIELLQRDPTIALLITDIVMPGDLQGPDLATQAREVIPKLPVIFMSGYPSEPAAHGEDLGPNDVTLLKPVSVADLAMAVQSVL